MTNFQNGRVINIYKVYVQLLLIIVALMCKEHLFCFPPLNFLYKTKILYLHRRISRV